jgi:hypothetical protein
MALLFTIQLPEHSGEAAPIPTLLLPGPGPELHCLAYIPTSYETEEINKKINQIQKRIIKEKK